jgi:hypothetical protein
VRTDETGDSRNQVRGRRLAAARLSGSRHRAWGRLRHTA